MTREIRLGNVSIGSGPEPHDNMSEVAFHRAADSGDEFVMVRAMFHAVVDDQGSVEDAYATARARARALFQQCIDILDDDGRT